jgi:parallel beta-helix repeat protein
MKGLQRVLAYVSAVGLALLGLAVVPAAIAEAATVVHCGDTITANTTLAADVGPCTDTAIHLGADNITLNLNGHTVTGTQLRNGDAPGIEGSGFSGDTVKNGIVTRFDTGVYFEFGGHETIMNIFAHDNLGRLDGDGIFGEGIQLFNVTDSLISNNQLIHNGPFAGIDIFDVTGTTISSNQVINNNVLEPLTTHCGSPDGCMQDIGIWVVFLTVPTSHNLVIGNTVVGSGLDGIQLSNMTSDNTVSRNNVTFNGWGQIPDPPGAAGPRDGDGIVVFGDHSLVERNTATKNAAKGIRVLGGTYDTVINNVAAGSGGGKNSVGKSFDLADTNPNCDHDTWHRNVFVTFNQPCVTH